MKRILINAVQKEEVRVAMVDGQQLYDLDVEVPSRGQKKSNVYKGKITRVEPSLEACFVDYGAERHGFLPFKEVSRMYFSEEAQKASGRPDIRTAIKEGQEIIIQVEKEERGNKGAAITTFISLAGRFLVLMPNNPRAGGVSRRIEGEDRNLIREALSQLKIPDGMGLIVRTAGVGRNTEELQWDLDYLLQLWTAFEKAATEKPSPFLIYQESDVTTRALRDYFRSDISEVLIDSKEVYDSAMEFVSQVMPNSAHKIKHYEDNVPLFNRFQVENQIESAYRREVQLPSGGAIVIDHTEALISIDVNSARATKGGDIEETATNTNLEAADEVARQLRLRDLGGLVVIDFIDMVNNRNQRAIESRLNAAVQADRARVQVGRISRFGLLEMSRQRLKPSLGESTQIVCPRCTGQGTIRTVESLSLSLVRILEEETLKSGTARVDLHAPIDVATYMLNEKRKAIQEIERLSGAHILIVANPTLETPQYRVERVRKSEHDQSSTVASYQRADKATQYDVDVTQEKLIQPEQAAVSSISPGRRPTAKAAPVEEKTSDTASSAPTSLLSKIVSIFSGDKSDNTEAPDKTRAGSGSEREGSSGQSRNQRGNQRGGQNRNRNRNKGRNRNRKPDKRQGGTNKPENKLVNDTAEKTRDSTRDSARDATKDSAAKSSDSGQSGSKSGTSSKSGAPPKRSRRRRGANRNSANRSRDSETAKDDAVQKNVTDTQAPSQDTKAASTVASQAKPKTDAKSVTDSSVADSNASAQKKSVPVAKAEKPGVGQSSAVKPGTEKSGVEKSSTDKSGTENTAVSSSVNKAVDKPIEKTKPAVTTTETAEKKPAKQANRSASRPISQTASQQVSKKEGDQAVRQTDKQAAKKTEEKSEKQPASNENRSVTSPIDD